ncbi:MAG: hypothetical protein KIS66_00360 [Fimbriimonadaceae bacterium]|nr:hypothetical protein [Fimbriimonadaceae bacterium]
METPGETSSLPPFEVGLLLGVLMGEGHFGGDGRQPHCTLKMHVRREPLLLWMLARFPEARLYGPYTHAGRHFYQLMFRGPALRDLLALLRQTDWERIDPHSHARAKEMAARYPKHDLFGERESTG